MSKHDTSVAQLTDMLNGPASSLEKVEAILTSPLIFAAAEAIPDKVNAGRPRDYPKYMWVVYHALVNHVWGSARKVHAEIGHPEVWRFMRKVVRRQFPDDLSMWLPATPMRRWHYNHACTYLRDPDVLQAMETIFREGSCELAVEMGLFSPEGPMSWTHPEPNRFMQSDGKVITPLYKATHAKTVVNTETGEIRSGRFDPDAKHHIEGGGNAAFGNKYVIVSARTERDRLILDVGHDAGSKGDGGEARTAMRCFEQLAPLLPGAQGVNYDKAMRGIHIDEAMRRWGLLILTRVHAVTDDAGDPVVRHIEDVAVVTPGGKTETIRVHSREGAAGLLALTETGEEHFEPLERMKTERRSDNDSYRLYNVYRLPPELGGGELRVRLTGNDRDEQGGLNRAEHLRAIPPSDPDFRGLFRRRNDAESLNRSIEDSLYIGRAHSVGAVAQEADLLGFALGLNALSWHRHRKRQAAAMTAAA